MYNTLSAEEVLAVRQSWEIFSLLEWNSIPQEREYILPGLLPDFLTNTIFPVLLSLGLGGL